MRTAHIVTRPHEVGDRVLALCGKKHKVKTLWFDIPDDNPICRDCVDTAITALDQADEVIQQARRRALRATFVIEGIGNVLNPEGGMILDDISDAADLYGRRRAEKLQAKVDREKAKSTCICEWTNQHTFTENPDCPIHGGPPPIAPPIASE